MEFPVNVVIEYREGVANLWVEGFDLRSVDPERMRDLQIHLNFVITDLWDLLEALGAPLPALKPVVKCESVDGTDDARLTGIKDALKGMKES